MVNSARKLRTRYSVFDRKFRALPWLLIGKQITQCQGKLSASLH